MKNITTGLIVVAVGGVSFFAGLQFAPEQPNKLAEGLNPQSAITIQPGISPRNGGSIDGMVTKGEILSISDTAITINTNNQGSKIIFYSDKTTAKETVETDIGNIKVGDYLSITGDLNDDGTISAKSIQITDTDFINQMQKIIVE